jgi:hypothetical protein
MPVTVPGPISTLSIVAWVVRPGLSTWIQPYCALLPLLSWKGTAPPPGLSDHLPSS